MVREGEGTVRGSGEGVVREGRVRESEVREVRGKW